MFLQSLRRLPPALPSGNRLRYWLAAWQSWCYSAVDRALGIELQEEEWRYLDGKAGARSPNRPPHDGRPDR